MTATNLGYLPISHHRFPDSLRLLICRLFHHHLHPILFPTGSICAFCNHISAINTSHFQTFPHATPINLNQHQSVIFISSNDYWN